MNDPTLYLQKDSKGTAETLIGIFENMPMVRIFDKDKTIYAQGDFPDCFYYLKKGRVKIFITSENGAEKTLSVAGKGAILGEAAFFDGQPRISSAKAIVHSELVSINKNVMTDIIRRSPRSALELLRLQAQTIRLLSSQVNSIAFFSAKSRIAAFLLDCFNHSNHAAVCTTHEEIGSAVGVTRVTVSKIVREFSKENLIETGYGKIIIKNAEALKKLIEL